MTEELRGKDHRRSALPQWAMRRAPIRGRKRAPRQVKFHITEPSLKELKKFVTIMLAARRTGARSRPPRRPPAKTSTAARLAGWVSRHGAAAAGPAGAQPSVLLTFHYRFAPPDLLSQRRQARCVADGCGTAVSHLRPAPQKPGGVRAFGGAVCRRRTLIGRASALLLRLSEWNEIKRSHVS